MRVEVRCYGLMRRPTQTVEMPAGSTVADLLASQGIEVRPEVAIFVDQERATPETKLQDGAAARIVVLAPALMGG